MRTKKCKNCGMTDYQQEGDLYICKYCNTKYEEDPKQETALQSILGFIERQTDKRREDKKEKRKHKEAEEKKGYKRKPCISVHRDDALSKLWSFGHWL